MNNDKVNPANVNPHFQRPEEFGLKPVKAETAENAVESNG